MKQFFAPFRVLAMTIALLCGLSFASSAATDALYDSYQYNISGAATPAPTGYAYTNIVKAQYTPAKSFGKPTDLFIGEDNRLYVLSGENASISVFDENLKYIETITLKQNNEVKEFADAGGMFITGTGNNRIIYVTSPSEGFVYICDATGNIRSSVGRPDTDLLDDSFVFQPTKVAVDSDGVLYVLSSGLYIGAAQYSPDGEFLGFFGNNKVQVTAKVLFDSFWKRMLNREQASKLARYVPVEYANFDVDKEKFIYTVTEKSGSNEAATGQIKKINFKNINIYKNKKYGDLEVAWDAARLIDSTFTDIAVMDDGAVAVLDSQRGRIFLYDEEGNWMNVFGSMGLYEGTFTKPVAIDTIGDHIYVLDQANESITLFEPTEYGKKIIQGFQLYNRGLYEESISVWRDVLDRNASFYPAFVGMGKGYMAQKEYKNAMKYFELGYDKSGYSAAYAKIRQNELSRNFGWIFGIASVLVIWLILSDRKKGARAKKFINPAHLPIRRKITYSLFHPTEGMPVVANTLPIKTMAFICGATGLLWFLSSALSWQYTGFIFSDVTAQESFNVFIHLGRTVMLLLIWSLANWFVCTMMDGSGKMTGILTVSSVALIPYILSINLLTLLSNYLTESEGVFLYVLQAVLIFWSLVLLLNGLKAIHEFSLGRTIVSLIFSVCAIAIMLIILLLLWSLYQQVSMFVSTLFEEISFMVR